MLEIGSRILQSNSFGKADSERRNRQWLSECFGSRKPDFEDRSQILRSDLEHGRSESEVGFGRRKLDLKVGFVRKYFESEVGFSHAAMRMTWIALSNTMMVIKLTSDNNCTPAQAVGIQSHQGSCAFVHFEVFGL